MNRFRASIGRRRGSALLWARVAEGFAPQERLKFAEERKEQGNALLKQEHHQESITRYVQALAYLGEVYASDAAELREKKVRRRHIPHRLDVNVHSVLCVFFRRWTPGTMAPLLCR
jgi:hypothetical protein